MGQLGCREPDADKSTLAQRVFDVPFRDTHTHKCYMTKIDSPFWGDKFICFAKPNAYQINQLTRVVHIFKIAESKLDPAFLGPKSKQVAIFFRPFSGRPMARQVHSEADVWTCENGRRTVLHAVAYDVCQAMDAGAGRWVGQLGRAVGREDVEYFPLAGFSNCNPGFGVPRCFFMRVAPGKVRTGSTG